MRGKAPVTRGQRYRPGRLDRGLLCCGVVARPLFVTAFLAGGARRPGYDPRRHPVSSLALGAGGGVQAANFAVTGVLYLALAAGLARTPEPAGDTRAGPVLIGAAAVGLLGAGAFATDPVSGYPPGTPGTPARYSSSGALHDLFSAPTFIGLPAAALAYARAFRRVGDCGWAAYSAGSAVVMLAAFGLASAGFSQVPSLVNHGGASQRACKNAKKPDTIDRRRRTVAADTPAGSPPGSTGCSTTCPSVRPVRWAVMNASTSAGRTSSGGLPTTVKNTFRSYAAAGREGASTVFGRHRPPRNSRYIR